MDLFESKNIRKVINTLNALVDISKKLKFSIPLKDLSMDEISFSELGFFKKKN